MGFLKDISSWLSGGKSSKDSSIRSATVKLRVFNKRLMRQIRKMEVSAKKARQKAVQMRKEGDLKGSKFQARNYLQVQAQVRALEQFRTNLEGLMFKMQNAQAIKDVGGIFQGIASSIAGLKQSVSLPKINELMQSIDMDMEDFEVTQEIATEGMTDVTYDTKVEDDQVDNVLAEIDAEIGVETGVGLPSAAGGDQKIKELEDELNRLKSE